MLRFRVASWFAVLALFLGGCSCDETTDPTDGGGMDGMVGPDGGGADSGVDSGMSCSGVGLGCAGAGECCPGLACEADGGGSLTCTPSACAGTGELCAIATDCCVGACVGGTCMDGARCTVIGAGCAGDGECCSSNCDGGSCSENPITMCDPVGERCDDRGDCCSDRCADSAGAPCSGTEGCRCELAGDCRPSGEICTTDGQCCIGLCDRPTGSTVGICAAAGACGVAGQPCGTEGLSGSCCSTACLDSSGTGTPVCQRLGGCLVQDEVCSIDASCCSGVCEDRGTGTDGRPIRRCANADSCLPPGEVCGDGGASSNCCPNGGGDTGCEIAAEGIRRCFGGMPGCTMPSETCTTDADCCVGTFPDLTCAAGPSGADVCCLPDGAECSFGSLCCSGICVPDSTGTLRCGSMCLTDGEACTTDSDCCGCGCVSDGMGGNTCTSDVTLCAPCPDAQLGEFCAMDSDCCNPDAVRCSTEVEFSTCVLRR